MTPPERLAWMPAEVRAKLEAWARDRDQREADLAAKLAGAKPTRKPRPPCAVRRPLREQGVAALDAEQAARMAEARRALVARGYGWMFQGGRR